jgi:hypothetical protein
MLQWIKWTGGIILAGVLTIWPANLLMHHTGKVDMNNLTPFQYWIQFLMLPALAFGGFVLLACVFAPLQKMMAGMVVFVMSLIFICMGIWQHYSDDGTLHNQYVARYLAFVVCMLTGLLLGYKLFRYRKWRT